MITCWYLVLVDMVLGYHTDILICKIGIERK